MLRSWWKKAVILLIAILAAAGMFLGWTSYNYSQQVRSAVLEENTNSARLWAAMVEARASGMYEHIYELLVTLYNNTELRTDSPIMSAQTKRKIVEMMDDKILVSSDVDALFVFDTQNDFRLFSARQSLSGMEILAMKNYTYESAVSAARDFGDLTWEAAEIDGADYLFKSVRLGKYVVGAISNLSHYHIDKQFSVLGEDYACRLLIGDKSYLCGGDAAGTELPASIQEGYRHGRVYALARIAVLDARVVLSARPGSLTGGSLSSLWLILDSAVCVILAILLLVLLRRDVARPTRALMRANQSLAAGDTACRLARDTAGSQEFEALYDSFNSMAEQIVDLRIETYDMKLQEEENKLTMLRAQIKPHSFLNAITTVSNMTYNNRPEEIRAYITDFAKFIRYMLKASSPWTTVEEELSHIESYLKMQEFRFPSSIRCTVDCDSAVKGSPIPFLILYTLVENSVKHAMTLYQPMELTIRCKRVETEAFRGVCLIEEDNGDGFPPEVLQTLLTAEPQSLYAKEHLGLSNVRYTLNLIYHRSDLLRLSNRPEGGARVEIRIPDEEGPTCSC